ncbi:hypothetical protein LZ198_12300 [Myxococcus sp. K15C18031901]|uniref:hypothetical protein n=1 Tax=Myxococcus dinghuensis TaxID=2906761 RepID=UPI0020A71627|nr:hypothetical protein [Myxococcus dinghuensis]MCP3099649.1 hypothetical protein [Myxococcus dinghuensis]
MEKKHRKIVVDDREYAWVGDWNYTQGRRVVGVRVWFKGQDPHTVGPVLSVKLVSKGVGMTDCAAALPHHVRAVILLARSVGWTPEGRGTFWLRPSHGLELDDLEVIEPE